MRAIRAVKRLGAVAAVLLAWSLGAAVLAPVAAAATDTDLADVTLTRHGGADRYATSLLVAEAVAAVAGGSLDSVVLAPECRSTRSAQRRCWLGSVRRWC